MQSTHPIHASFYPFAAESTQIVSAVKYLMQDAGRVCYTLFLFTRSDLLTVLIPTTVFGTMGAPSRSLFQQLIPRIFWVWIHLLQFAVANQCIRPEEDMYNKPWRPIPSRRISQSAARVLRWSLIPACLLLSAIYRIPTVGLVLAVAFYCNNELEFDSHWLLRNLCNAVGYTAFNVGASSVLYDPKLGTRAVSLYAHALNAMLIMTTIHAQDFRDVVGDKAIGRQTFPTVFPRAARVSMLLLLPFWSIFLSGFWRLPTVLTVTFVLVGTYVGFEFFTSVGNVTRDKIAYRDYNIWLCLVHIIPFLSRFY